MLKSDLITQLKLNAAQFNRIAQGCGVGIKNVYTDEEIAQIKSNSDKGFSNPQHRSHSHGGFNPSQTDFTSTEVDQAQQFVNQGQTAETALSVLGASDATTAKVLQKALEVQDQELQQEIDETGTRIGKALANANRQRIAGLEGFFMERLSAQTMLSDPRFQVQTIEAHQVPDTLALPAAQ